MPQERPKIILRLFLILLLLTLSQSSSRSSPETCDSDGQEDVCGASDYTEESVKKDGCGLVVGPSTIPNAGLGVFTTRPLAVDEIVGYPDLVIPLPRFPSSLPNPFEDYSWNGRIYSGDLDAFCPGLQSLLNSNLALLNVHQVKPAAKLVPDTVDSTMYHNLETIAEQNIPEGGELFAFYGDHWFQLRERFKSLPHASDFPEAENLTKAFAQIGGDDQYWQHDLWELVKTFPFQSKTIKALPEFQDVRQVIQLGIRSLFQPQATMDIEEELLRNRKTRCLDWIKPGPSSVHAIGAFAARSFTKGMTITGSPLLHTSLERWNAYGQVWDSFSQTQKKSQSDHVEYALLVNYCWGHSKTSLLLCPYGSGVSYINHHRSKANVRIQWAPEGHLAHNSSTLDLSPSALSKTVKPSLAIDYVATRDIQEGEELFLDYGSAWEKAYNAHLWQPPREAASADEWNLQRTLLTESEQVFRPYPHNLEMMCHPDVMKPELHFNMKYLWEESVEPKTTYPCQVLQRQQHETHAGYVTYAMRVFYEGEWRGRAGIPREYIRFFQKDGPQQKPFRHPMQLPDELFPEAWRDVR